LSSSSPSVMTVPPTVTIAAGTASQASCKRNGARLGYNHGCGT
jgi:hypothetical protein